MLMKPVTTAQSEVPHFRVVATSLRPDDIAAADEIANALRAEGWPHANRSLVIREAVTYLADSLRGKSPDQIFMHFIHRLGKRVARESNSDGSV